jgi:hypothetical protein
LEKYKVDVASVAPVITVPSDTGVPPVEGALVNPTV